VTNSGTPLVEAHKPYTLFAVVLLGTGLVAGTVALVRSPTWFIAVAILLGGVLMLVRVAAAAEPPPPGEVPAVQADEAWVVGDVELALRLLGVLAPFLVVGVALLWASDWGLGLYAGLSLGWATEFVRMARLLRRSDRNGAVLYRRIRRRLSGALLSDWYASRR
jgi:hypothetical protein